MIVYLNSSVRWWKYDREILRSWAAEDLNQVISAYLTEAGKHLSANGLTFTVVAMGEWNKAVRVYRQGALAASEPVTCKIADVITQAHAEGVLAARRAVQAWFDDETNGSINNTHEWWTKLGDATKFMLNDRGVLFG